MLGQWFAVSAGFCAAMASVCAKLAMTLESTLHVCNASVNLSARYLSLLSLEFGRQEMIQICDKIVPYLRVTMFAMIFVFNAIMWAFFTKSLQKSASSIEATVTNTASNFFCTAVLGWLLFGEALSLLWWMGASLLILGLYLMHTATMEQRPVNAKISRSKKAY